MEEAPVIRVQVAPKRDPRYVSVILDARSSGGRLRTLHSFGRDCLMARIQADRFRADCLLAYQYLRQSIDEADRLAVAALLGPVLGFKTLHLLAPRVIPDTMRAAAKKEPRPRLEVVPNRLEWTDRGLEAIRAAHRERRKQLP
jgi:hypothetical protein